MWKNARAEAAKELGRTPTSGDNCLLDSLADLFVETAILRARRQYGEDINVEHLRGCVSETRRLRMCLGLVERDAKLARRRVDDLSEMLEEPAA